MGIKSANQTREASSEASEAFTENKAHVGDYNNNYDSNEEDTKDKDGSVEGEAHEERATGYVKWFDRVKGYGFIVPFEETPDSDILIHRSVIQQYGVNELKEAHTVECHYQSGPRGHQATKIIQLSEPTEQSLKIAAHMTRSQIINEDAPTVETEIKWFSPQKGYGFLSNADIEGDIFVHKETIRMANISDLQPGDKLHVIIEKRDRGWLATAVSAQRSQKPKDEESS